MSAPVDVLAVLDAAIDNLQGAGYIGNTIGMKESRAAVAELIGAARARVAMTFDEALAANDRGERLIFCQCDVLNPCWAPGMPLTTPVRHWGYTPDMEGDGLACPDCQLRAALARVGGAS